MPVTLPGQDSAAPAGAERFPADRRDRPSPSRRGSRLPGLMPARRLRRAARPLALLFPAIPVLTGCAAGFDGALGGAFDAAPFVYEDLAVVHGAVPDCHEHLGLYVSIRNTSAKAFSAFSHSFYLFTEDGTPLGTVQTRRVRGEVEASLQPGDAEGYCTSLDSVFHFLPAETTEVRQYRIDEIRFDDGGRWRPVTASYAYPYPARAEQAGEAGAAAQHADAPRPDRSGRADPPRPRRLDRAARSSAAAPAAAPFREAAP